MHLPSWQKLLKMIIPTIDDATVDDGDIEQQLAVLPAALGASCCGMSRHDRIVNISVSRCIIAYCFDL